MKLEKGKGTVPGSRRRPKVPESRHPDLKYLGYTPVAFSSPTDALESFAAAPEQFYLVSTDYRMPTMNGQEFAMQIKAIRGDIPVVLISGNIQSTTEKALRTDLFCDILHKPVKISTFSVSIAKAIKSNCGSGVFRIE
ncbi:MAG: response regulator [Planctomycetota bacterium]|nr:response regulator [Planctomycetota bacterium]